MKKVIFGILALIAIAGIVVVTQLDSLIEKGIETEGPKTLKVSLSIESIHVSPFSGKVTVTGLDMGQPKGFGEGSLLKIGSFDMQVEPMSLLGNHIIIDSINIASPMMDVRIIDKKNNFVALQEGLDVPATEEPAKSEDEITLTIRKLVVTNPLIAAKSDSYVKIDKDIHLADFTLTNIGTDEKGLAPHEVARHIMDTLQPQISKALIEAGASAKIQDLAKDSKEKLKKKLGGLLDKIKDK